MDILFDEVVKNTQTFDWPIIIELIAKIAEVPDDLSYKYTPIRDKLKSKLNDATERFISMRALIVLELLTNRDKRILLQFYRNDRNSLVDVLINLTKTTKYENIRKKLLSLFGKWHHQELSCLFFELTLKLNAVLVQFSSSIKGKNVPEGLCYRCEICESKIICAACIQLMCDECSSKTISLTQFGFQEKVRVCDDCFISAAINEGTSGTSGLSNPISITSETSPSSKEETENSAFLTTLECPICLDIMQKPIIQCILGHSMCEICTIRITVCPICKSEMTKTRNFIAENLVEHQKITCTFTGCKTVVKLHEKELHEEWCKFRPTECEGKKFCKWSCEWTGAFNEIVQHFNESHRAILHMPTPPDQSGKDQSKKLSLNEDFKGIYLVNWQDGKEFFWLKYKVDTKKRNVYWIVQQISSEATYFYKIKIFHSEQQHTRISFRDTCATVTADAEECFERKKCIVATFNQLENYTNNKKQFNFMLIVRQQ